MPSSGTCSMPTLSRWPSPGVDPMRRLSRVSLRLSRICPRQGQAKPEAQIQATTSRATPTAPERPSSSLLRRDAPTPPSGGPLPVDPLRITAGCPQSSTPATAAPSARTSPSTRRRCSPSLTTTRIARRPRPRPMSRAAAPSIDRARSHSTGKARCTTASRPTSALAGGRYTSSPTAPTSGGRASGSIGTRSRGPARDPSLNRRRLQHRVRRSSHLGRAT